MTLYTDIVMEPIPIQCNTAMTSYTVNPVLPEGMTFNGQTGLISGKLTTTSDASVVYTVTASNSYGSTTTTFSFRARSQMEMTRAGMTACFWAEVTECLTPDFSFFYSKPAQICQIVNNIYFTDNYDFTSWPGLDARFVDYFAAYFYGYFNVVAAGTYQILMNADDGAMLYVDDVTTPVIDIPGCWATSETSNSITLEQGRHLVIIRYFEYNDGATVYLKLGSTDLGIPMAVIAADQLRVGGRGPTFIHYDFVSGYAGTSIAVARPELNSGAPHLWSITTLPAGLSFDSTNGYISGIPVAASSGVYTVTATGVNGVASTTVRIVITAAPLMGVTARYYKIMDAQHCIYPSLKGNVVSLKSIQIDSDINHPSTAASVLWPHTPAEFTTYFYVEWEGYLKMEAIGNWKLRLTCDDGCKLFGADDQLLLSHWGCHSYTSQETVYPVSANGYYYFRIEYAQNTNTKGIVFEWQSPVGAMEVVPADKMFHAPSGVLSYTTELGHYFKGAPITDNTPIAFSVASFTGFTVTPPLPAGLSINPANGIISGTPTTEQNTAYYTISALANGVTETTVIGFDVQYVAPPTGLEVRQNGVALTASSPITVIPLISIPSITVYVPSGITINSYSISPALPEGLVFNESNGSITGKAIVSSPVTTYMITASNLGGSTFLTFAMSVSGCKGMQNGQAWTNSFHILHMTTGIATVEIKKNNAVTQCSVNQMGSDGNALMQSCSASLQAGDQMVFCIPPGNDNTITLTCNDSYGCYYQLRRENGNRFPTRLAYHPTEPKPYIDTWTLPSTLTPLTMLTLSQTSMDVVSGAPLTTVTITPDGCYKTIEVSPSMGMGVDLPLMLPRLSGTLYGRGTTTYTITATGDAGTATATLQVRFVECFADNGYEVVTFQKTTIQYGTEESYKVFDKDDNLLITAGPFTNYGVHTVTQCMTSGVYKVYLLDSYGDGWAEGASLRVTGTNGNIIDDISWNGAGSTQQIQELVVNVVNSATESWLGLISGRPSKKWNEPGADLSSWTSYTSGELGTWSQATVYMVRRFTIDDVMDYPLIEFGIYYRDGLVVYLNGNVVYTRNVPTNPSHTTYANTQYDDYYERLGSAPGHLLREGENVLAVEVHRHSSTQGPILWRGFVRYSPSSCISRIDSGYITESSHYNKDTETAAQAWDRNTLTNWVENGIPAWTTYAYNFDRMEWVNKLVIGSNSLDANLDPVKVTVYGSTNGVDYVPLYSVTKKAMFSARKQPKEFMMMDHLSSYGRYKIEISESASGDLKTAISYLDLLACQLSYCPKDKDYPGTMAGTTVTIDCPEGTIGERIRTCGEADLKPAWGEPDESECRSMNPPKKFTYIDVAYVISGVTMEAMQSQGAEYMLAVLSVIVNVDMSTMEAWKLKDVTETYVSETMGEAVKTVVYVRFTLGEDIASDALNSVMGSLATMKSMLKENYGDVFGDINIEFYIEPILSQRKNLGAVSITLIVIMVVCILVIIAIAAFYIWVRTKSKKSKNGAKRLESFTTQILRVLPQQL